MHTLALDVINRDFAAHVFRIGIRLCRRKFLDADVRKHGRLEHLSIVRTNANPDIHWPVQADRRGHRRLKRLSDLSYRRQELGSAPLKTNANARVHARPYLRSLRSWDGTELERGQAVPVQGNVGISGIGIEILAHGQYGLAMAFHALANEVDVGCDNEIPRDSLPDKMKRVHRPPHVGAAPSDAIFAGGRVIGSRAFSRVIAHVAMRFEQADGVWMLLRCSQRRGA